MKPAETHLMNEKMRSCRPRVTDRSARNSTCDTVEAWTSRFFDTARCLTVLPSPGGREESAIADILLMPTPTPQYLFFTEAAR